VERRKSNSGKKEDIRTASKSGRLSGRNPAKRRLPSEPGFSRRKVTQEHRDVSAQGLADRLKRARKLTKSRLPFCSDLIFRQRLDTNHMVEDHGRCGAGPGYSISKGNSGKTITPAWADQESTDGSWKVFPYKNGYHGFGPGSIGRQGV